MKLKATGSLIQRELGPLEFDGKARLGMSKSNLP
jgi:hypothetical protein